MLVVVAAVFLAYNANSGLPFVPVYELKVDVPNAARLVAGNEVREGGHRIGRSREIPPIGRKDGTTGARADAAARQRPRRRSPSDSTIRIRPRSALGLKYVELLRGRSRDTLADGATITASADALGPELDDFFELFDEKTRDNVDRNIDYFGDRASPAAAWRSTARSTRCPSCSATCRR